MEAKICNTEEIILKNIHNVLIDKVRIIKLFYSLGKVDVNKNYWKCYISGIMQKKLGFSITIVDNSVVIKLARTEQIIMGELADPKVIPLYDPDVIEKIIEYVIALEKA